MLPSPHVNCFSVNHSYVAGETFKLSNQGLIAQVPRVHSLPAKRNHLKCSFLNIYIIFTGKKEIRDKRIWVQGNKGIQGCNEHTSSTTSIFPSI